MLLPRTRLTSALASPLARARSYTRGYSAYLYPRP